MSLDHRKRQGGQQPAGQRRPRGESRPTSSSPGMRLAAGRVGGEGRCLAAEVRPYLELAECLSPSRVRGGGAVGIGEGEEGRRLPGGGGGLPERKGPSPLPVRSQERPQARRLAPRGGWGSRGTSCTHLPPPTRCLSPEQDVHPTTGIVSKAHHPNPADRKSVV